MKLLSRFRLRTKLILLIGLAGLSMVAVATTSATMLSTHMVEDRIDKLRAVVDAMRGIADGLQARVAAGDMTREQAMDRFRDNIHIIRFDNGVSYLAADTTAGINFAHGWKPSIEGKPS